MNFDCASDHVSRQFVKFHLRDLRDLRGVEESRLFLNRTEGQHRFAKQLIEHLREASVNRGKAAEDPFVAGEMFEAGAGIARFRRSVPMNMTPVNNPHIARYAAIAVSSDFAPHPSLVKTIIVTNESQNKP